MASTSKAEVEEWVDEKRASVSELAGIFNKSKDSTPVQKRYQERKNSYSTVDWMTKGNAAATPPKRANQKPAVPAPTPDQVSGHYRR